MSQVSPGRGHTPNGMCAKRYQVGQADATKKASEFVTELFLLILGRLAFDKINPYGKYQLDVEEGLNRSRLRPLLPSNEQITT